MGVLSPLLFKTSWTNSIGYMAIALVVEGIAFYGRVKQSLKLNRIMYVLLGAPIGFALWFISIIFIESTFYPQAANDSVFFIGSMIVCFGIGALIGDFVGKLRNYKGPGPYQP
jgi:hypothetical protein